MGNEIIQLNVNDIIPNRYQPREVFDDNSLKELSESINQHGVIQPIIVRKKDDKYEIVDGERRYRASLLSGLTKVPAIVRDYTDNESARIALIDNLQRQDLTPIEEARAYKKLIEMDNMTQERLAVTLGKSQSAVANKLRLLNLPLEVQEALLMSKISERHARSLLTEKDTKLQIDLLNKIIEKRMTVRELDSEIKNMSNMFIPEEFNNQAINQDTNNVDNKDNNANNTNNQFIVPMDNIGNNDYSLNIPNTNNAFNDVDGNYKMNNSDNNFINNTISNNQSNNPFFTNQDYIPPTDVPNTMNNSNNINNEVNNDMFTNPFAAIRNNTQMQNNINNQGNNLGINPTDNTMETKNLVNNDYNANSINNENNDDNVLNGSADFNVYNQPSTFNIDDYKLPNVNYSDETITKENDMINNNKENMETNTNSYKYVEDNPNYRSVDTNYGVKSLNDVINVLKDTLEILKQGQIKVETEEIDFDDVYQIVIKVDKKGNYDL